VSHHEHAEVERNYVGNENVLEKLRESDFESKAHHDCNELRAEVRHDYNEAHMADAAGHTHLSVEHTHSEEKDAEPVHIDAPEAEAESKSESESADCEQQTIEAKTDQSETHEEQQQQQRQREEEELEDFSKLRVADLRERLVDLDLPTDGRKADLIRRLEEHYAGSGAEAHENGQAEIKEETKADMQPEETPEQPMRVKRERKQVARLEAGPATSKWSEYATKAKTDGAEVEAQEDAVEDLSSLTVAVLKNRLAELGMPTDGKKAVLVERLQDALINGVPEVDDTEEETDDEQVELLTKETIKTWTVAELKAELAARELSTTGVKATLIKRLANEL
jgi:hypothetical protein